MGDAFARDVGGKVGLAMTEPPQKLSRPTGRSGAARSGRPSVGDRASSAAGAAGHSTGGTIGEAIEPFWYGEDARGRVAGHKRGHTSLGAAELSFAPEASGEGEGWETAPDKAGEGTKGGVMGAGRGRGERDARRTRKNERERQRRNEVSEGFSNLATILGGIHTKAEKAPILQSAVAAVKDLSGALDLVVRAAGDAGLDRAALLRAVSEGLAPDARSRLQALLTSMNLDSASLFSSHTARTGPDDAELEAAFSGMAPSLAATLRERLQMSQAAPAPSPASSPAMAVLRETRLPGMPSRPIAAHIAPAHPPGHPRVETGAARLSHTSHDASNTSPSSQASGVDAGPPGSTRKVAPVSDTSPESHPGYPHGHRAPQPHFPSLASLMSDDPTAAHPVDTLDDLDAAELASLPSIDHDLASSLATRYQRRHSHPSSSSQGPMLHPPGTPDDDLDDLHLLSSSPTHFLHH